MMSKISAKQIVSIVLFSMCILCAFAPTMWAETLDNSKAHFSLNIISCINITPFAVIALSAPVVIFLLKCIRLSPGTKNVIFIAFGILLLFSFNQCSISAHSHMRTFNPYQVMVGFGLFAYPTATLLYLAWTCISENYTSKQILSAMGLGYTE